MFTYKKTAPVEIHRGGGRKVTVVRADLVPDPPLPPYLKMIELLRFVEHLRDTVNPPVIGYYAQDSSDWTRIIPKVCNVYGIRGVVGFSQKKEIPWFIKEIEDSVHWISPNVYAVNWGRMRSYIEGELKGYMLPMGVDHPFVVKSLKEFFDNAPLPESGTLLVPVGSGVALSGILRHLNNRKCTVVGITTRPVGSVKKVVDKYWRPGWSKVTLRLVQGDDKDLSDMPFPGHRFWERQAWGWMIKHITELKGSLCYVNLGS